VCFVGVCGLFGGFVVWLVVVARVLDVVGSRERRRGGVPSWSNMMGGRGTGARDCSERGRGGSGRGGRRKKRGAKTEKKRKLRRPRRGGGEESTRGCEAKGRSCRLGGTRTGENGEDKRGERGVVGCFWESGKRGSRARKGSLKRLERLGSESGAGPEALRRTGQNPSSAETRGPQRTKRKRKKGCQRRKEGQRPRRSSRHRTRRNSQPSSQYLQKGTSDRKIGRRGRRDLPHYPSQQSGGKRSPRLTSVKRRKPGKS